MLGTRYINQLVVEDLCTPVMLGAMLLGAKPPVVSHRNLFETKNNSHSDLFLQTCLGEEITGLYPCCQFCVQDMLSCGPATYKASVMRNLASKISSGKYSFVIFLIPFLIVILSLIHKLFYSSAGNPEERKLPNYALNSGQRNTYISFYFLSISILFLYHYLIFSYPLKFIV